MERQRATLMRVERLFWRNERAVMPLKPGSITGRICLVPVAGNHGCQHEVTGLAETLDLRYTGPRRIACDLSFREGDEIGYLQQGSTIILLATGNCVLCDDIEIGATIRMGRALLADTTFRGRTGESP